MKIEAGKFYRTRNGRKAGPMGRGSDYYGPNSWLASLGGSSIRCSYLDSGSEFSDRHSPNDLVAEWPDGPVRTVTVTRKEIVPGVYGKIRVTGTYKKDHATLDWADGDAPAIGLDAAELRAAAATLTEIAAALEAAKGE